MTDEGPVTGTFLVTAADEGATLLSAVDGGRVHPLATDADLAVGDVVEGTLEPAEPLAVTWKPAHVTDLWRPAIEVVDGPPGDRAREVAAELAIGQLERLVDEDGELHVLSVDPDRTAAATEEVVSDETTRRIAARLGAKRVEVRGEEGVVAVRYWI